MQLIPLHPQKKILTAMVFFYWLYLIISYRERQKANWIQQKCKVSTLFTQVYILMHIIAPLFCTKWKEPIWFTCTKSVLCFTLCTLMTLHFCWQKCLSVYEYCILSYAIKSVHKICQITHYKSHLWSQMLLKVFGREIKHLSPSTISS